MLLIVNTLVLFFDKHRKQLLLFSAAFWGFALLVWVSYPDQNTPEFYIENIYSPLTVFLIVPFVFQILSGRRQQLAILLIAILSINGIVRMYQQHNFYTQRLAWFNKLIDKYDGQKVILNEKNFPKDILLMGWGSPYEIWLLSTIERGATASIIISSDPESLRWACDAPDQMVTTWGAFPYKVLPSKYFPFKDTKNRYNIE
jgi:hypothetical protein